MLEIFKIISIILATMLKFIFGPILGYTAGYPYLLTVIITVIGMMCSVVLFTYFGLFLRKNVIDRMFKKRKTFSKRSRQFVRVWRKYGVKGVAFFTPLLLTPIGGTLVLAGFNTSKSQIIVYMLVSGVFWSLILTGVTYLLGDTFIELFS